MAKRLKFLKAGSLYFIGNIFDKAVAFITVPIFTRLLTTEEYGITTTYLSWVSILSVLLTLSLGNSIRTAVVDFDNEKDEYMSSIFFLGSLSAILMTFSICIISSFVVSKTVLVLILCCCVHSYSSSIIQAVQWRYMMDVKYLQRTLLQSLPNIIVIVLSILFISQMTTNRYFGRVFAYTVTFLIIAILYILYYFRKGKVFYNKKYWKYAIGFSAPIIFHSMSTVILSQADRSMITLFRNASETGLYGLAYQFGMVPLVVTTTFENVWIPWFTKKMETGNKSAINKMAIPYINVVAVMCVGVMLVAPEFLKIMTTRDYYDATYIIAPVVLATFLMFLASISLDLEYYLKRTKTIATNTLVAAVINIVLNLIFIPSYGAVAAAYTTVASYMVSFVMHYFVARRLDNQLFPTSIYFIPIAIVFVGTVITNITMNHWIVRWVSACIIMVVFAVVCLRKYDIKGIFRKE